MPCYEGFTDLQLEARVRAQPQGSTPACMSDTSSPSSFALLVHQLPHGCLTVTMMHHLCRNLACALQASLRERGPAFSLAYNFLPPGRVVYLEEADGRICRFAVLCCAFCTLVSYHVCLVATHRFTESTILECHKMLIFLKPVSDFAACSAWFSAVPS